MSYNAVGTHRCDNACPSPIASTVGRITQQSLNARWGAPTFGRWERAGSEVVVQDYLPHTCRGAGELADPLPGSLLCHGRPPRRSRPLCCLGDGRLGRGPCRCRLRDTMLRCLADWRFLRQSLLRRRRLSRDGCPGTPRRSSPDGGFSGPRTRPTEDGECPRSRNKDGLVTRRPLNRDHATPDVGHDAASRRLVHLCGHQLNLVTDFGHEALLTTLVEPSVDQRSWIGGDSSQRNSATTRQSRRATGPTATMRDTYDPRPRALVLKQVTRFFRDSSVPPSSHA